MSEKLIAVICGCVMAFVLLGVTGCSKGFKFSVGVSPVSAIDETQKFEADDSVGLVSNRKDSGRRY